MICKRNYFRNFHLIIHSRKKNLEWRRRTNLEETKDNTTILIYSQIFYSINYKRHQTINLVIKFEYFREIPIYKIAIIFENFNFYFGIGWRRFMSFFLKVSTSRLICFFRRIQLRVYIWRTEPNGLPFWWNNIHENDFSSFCFVINCIFCKWSIVAIYNSLVSRKLCRYWWWAAMEAVVAIEINQNLEKNRVVLLRTAAPVQAMEIWQLRLQSMMKPYNSINRKYLKNLLNFCD